MGCFAEGFLLNRLFSHLHRALPAFLLVAGVFAEQNDFIGIQRFSISSPAISYYQAIDVLLFQRLNFEFLPNGIKPMVVVDTIPKSCKAVVSGSIDLVDSIPILLFKISGTGSMGKEEETKRIALNDQPVDAIVDILTLKIRHYLEQNITGKLRISSNPPECDVYLNGMKTGSTPTELILEEGRYALELRRIYFAPFMDSLTILPGHENAIQASMRFEGNNTQPWFISAIVLTTATITAQLLELHYRDEYLSSTSGNFNNFYGRYQSANIVKVCISIPTAVSWIIATHHYIQNKTLKKEIFGDKL